MSLTCIPRSHPEELNNISLLDRLNRMEGMIRNVQSNVDQITAEHIGMKDINFIKSNPYVPPNVSAN
jgi:hypothetical protein